MNKSIWFCSTIVITLFLMTMATQTWASSMNFEFQQKGYEVHQITLDGSTWGPHQGSGKVIKGTNKEFRISIYLPKYKGPGTYSLASGNQLEENTLVMATLSAYWPTEYGPGKLTITKDDGKVMEGTFEVTVYYAGHDPDSRYYKVSDEIDLRKGTFSAGK